MSSLSHAPARTLGRSVRRLLTASVAVAGLAVTVAPLSPTEASASVARPGLASTAPNGSYVPLEPLRMMDTRYGLGLSRAGRIGAGQVVTTTLGGTGRLPAASEVSAVVLNLSTVHPTAGTFLTVYPADVTRPPTSSINIGSLDSVTNLVTVPLHADGRVSVYNAVGSIDAIIDVVGYYAATDAGAQRGGIQYGGFTAVEPYRKLDSRLSNPQTPFGDYYWYKLVFNFPDQTFNNSITAAVVNISAVSATRSGFFTAWDGDSGPDYPPATSSVNFRRGENKSNLAIVKVGHDNPDGKPQIMVLARVPAGTVHGLVDVVGLMTTPGSAPDGAEDARFAPFESSSRIIDTRRAELGGPAFGPGETRSLTGAPVVTATTTGIAGNLTLVSPTRPSYLTTWPSDLDRPTVSTITANAGAIVANGAIVALGLLPRPDATAFFAFNAAGTANVVFDAAGTFEVAATPFAAAAHRGPKPVDAVTATGVARPARS